MKTVFMVLLGTIFALGCARVKVEAPKEPIKVDISMRVDIYQHVLKDINAIEDVVSGGNKENKSGENQSLLGYFIESAYAQESLSPQVEEAALRRKDRYAELNSWMKKAVIGEKKDGLLEIKNYALATASLQELVKAENKDRLIIYSSLAEKNNVSEDEIQKVYAVRLQKDAPSGTPIEVQSEPNGLYEWKIK